MLEMGKEIKSSNGIFEFDAHKFLATFVSICPQSARRAFENQCMQTDWHCDLAGRC